MQTTLTIIAILAAATYAVWRVYGVLRGKIDPCDGCELKKNCKKFCQSK